MEFSLNGLKKNTTRAIIHSLRLLRWLSNSLHGTHAIVNPLQTLSVSGKQTFFGYYDKTPFSFDGKKILGLVAPRANIPSSGKDDVIIGYFDACENFSFQEIGNSSTWCWQQGCRLQWFPGAENKLVIYNALVDGSYGSILQNVTSRKILRKYQFPIYDVDNAGKYAISLNFSRLHRLRPGYGYVNFADQTAANPCPDNDGVWRLDLNSGKADLIISLEKLATIQPVESMYGAEHYINHLSFNPSGKRFMFFHLWMKNQKRYSRLFTCNSDGNDLYLLTNEGMVSHYTWKNDDDLLVYSYHGKTGQQYHLYQDKTDIRQILAPGLLTQDGHPSYHPKNICLLTDTYPDRYSDRSILVYDLKKNVETVGSYFSPLSFVGEVRCDLHPRWNRLGNQICFDSAHEGYRNMYLMNYSRIS
jgi:hypothetical protein